MRSVNVLRALARGCTACAILAAAGAAQAQINEDWSSGTENGWTTSSEQGFSTWVFDPFLGQWFGDDIAPPVSPNNLPESQYLTSPTFTMGADPGLEVEHWFDMENGFDGGVLEISVNGGPFTYVGGEYILAGQGYNGVISPNFQSHIMNQEAFTNISSAGAGVFITSSFYLADFAQPGDMVQIRFRLATDISVGDDGWYITRVSSVPLANPTGACCFLGGSCSDLTQVDCSAQGGTFMEGIACGVGLCPEGPRGDLCTDPIVIPSAPFIDSVTDLENYSGDPDIASCNSSTALEMNHAVWWSFAGTGERMRVSLRQVNMDAALAVFEGTDCGALTQLNCTDADMVNFDFDTVVGMTYYFVGMQWSSALLTDTNNTINIDLRVAPPPPTNDMCDSAEVIMSVPYTGTAAGLEALTGSPDIASCNASGATMNNDAWWVFAGTGQRMRVTMSDPNFTFDEAFAVFEAPDCGSLSSASQLGCSDPSPWTFDFNTQVGMNYYFVAMNWSSSALGDTGNEATISLELAPPPPANDECDNAIILSLDTPASGTTADGSGTNVASCGGHTRDVYYAFLPMPNGKYRVFTTGATVNMSLAVFSQGCPGSGVEIACADPAGNDASVQFTADGIGSAILIRAATSGTSSTSFNITVEEVASGCTGTDGLCRMSTVSDCAAAGGAFLGVDCAVGACCNGGACSTVAGGDCADGGGAYQGDGTICDASANVTSAPNLPIPDNSPTGLSDVVFINDSETITTVEVIVDMAHTWMGDIILTLQGPNGASVDLVGRAGVVGGVCCGYPANLGGAYLFSDSGSQTWDMAGVGLVTGDLFPVGTYLPATFDGVQTSLNSTFAGSDAAGAWTLTVSDNANIDTGSLFSWGLLINGGVGGACDAAPTCVCETDGNDAQVNVFDLLAYLDLWFPSAAGADIDGTPGVNVFDLLFFLDCWFPASAGNPC